jgi:hypothetical protein
MTTEQQYIRGFNHGYLLAEHLPDLTTKLIKSIQGAAGDYLAGFLSGKEEYELEVTQTKLNELNQIRGRSTGRDLDREH